MIKLKLVDDESTAAGAQTRVNKPVKVLIIEDSEDDAKLALLALRRGGFDPTHRRVQTAAELESALAEGGWDTVISDFNMPGFTGMDALRILRSTGLDIPFILISGTIGEDTAVSAMKAGASDYVMKKSLARLAPALERELKETQMRAAHRRAQAALTDSEKRFRQMAENIRDVFFLLDADGTSMLYISPAYEEVSGRTCESLYANPESWIEAIHQDDRASTYEKYKKGMLAGNAEFEYRIVRPDGSIRWIKLRGFPVRDDAGNLVRITGVAEDITERKRAEEAREHREAELQESQRIARIGSWTWTPATGVVTWSDGLDHVLARDRALPAPSFETLPKFYTPESWQRLGAAIARTLDTGASYDLELEMIRADGAACWTATRGEAIRGPDGTVVKLRWTVHDITERKRAEQDLRESERRFSDMLDNVALVSVMLDREERITYCNEHLLRLTGWRLEEVIGRTWSELFVPPEINDRKDAFAALLANRPEAWHRENEILTRSGERRLIRWNNSVLRSGAGDVIGTASIGEDITERKRAEQALVRLVAIIEATPDMVATGDPNGHALYYNRAGLRMLGFEPGLDPSTVRFLDTHSDWAAKLIMEEGIPHAIEHGTWSGETALLRRDGREIPISQVISYTH